MTLSSLVGLASPAHAQFAFEAIDGLTTDWIRVSGDGQIVTGNSLNINGVAEPALWTRAGGVVRLGALPGGSGGTSLGLSPDGRAVVGAARSARGTEAFLWTAGQGIVGLGDLPGTDPMSSVGWGVSNDGQVVVGASTGSWPRSHAFRWTTATGLVPLGDLPGGEVSSTAFATTPDGQTIVGSSLAAISEEAFVWTAATGMIGLGHLPTGAGTRALAVSADGNVVVGMGVSASGFEAFRWTRSGGLVGLGSLDPLDFASRAEAVSADGNVVVGIGSGAADFNGEAFVWFPATGMLNLRHYLLANGVTSVQGWRLIDATGISADGRVIVGTALNPQNQPRAWIAHIEVDRRPPTEPLPDGPETVSPAALSVGAGTLVSGGAAQLHHSDDSYLRLRETGARTIQATVSGRVAKPAVGELRFAIEAAAVGSTTRQQISLFDFAARQWVTVSDTTAAASDASMEIRVTDRPGRFIETGTLRVQARLSFTPSGGRRVTTNVRVDRAAWTRIP